MKSATQNRYGPDGLMSRTGGFRPNRPKFRWKRDDKGQVMRLNELPILQFLGICDKVTGLVSLPSSLSDKEDTNYEENRCSASPKAATSNNDTLQENMEAHLEATRVFFKNKATKLEVFKDYWDYDDVTGCNNTDNAWVEVVAVNFHDGTGKYLDHCGQETDRTRWIDIDESLKIDNDGSAQLIRKTCEARSAYCSI
ncbi:ADP-ribose pyrophosphatase, mitochondrial-like [Convolutriloba macropyga]|uniref:ADP-ribose pyrophosphatase, mitochondrial-like n=1 Tax=Convolutriloba macropyga TaxID=536237 RepID=UPI003F52298C